MSDIKTPQLERVKTRAEFPFPPPKVISKNSAPPQEDKFEKFATSPKFIEFLKIARNALSGAGSANMIMSLAMGGAIHPLGIGVGLAVGLAYRYLQKKGYLRPVERFLKEKLGKLPFKIHVARKTTKRSRRMLGQMLDWAGDSTFGAEAFSALVQSFSPLAKTLNSYLFPINAIARFIDLPVDVKNYEDIARNRDPNVSHDVHMQDLRAEFAHVMCGFLETAGAFIPPISPVTIGLNVGLQALAFIANRWRDKRDISRKWLQGYDSVQDAESKARK